MDSPQHRNNIGLARLVFATGVILTHGYEQYAKGMPSPDPLQSLTGNGLTVAALCVDAFFLLSGYLIVQSMENSTSIRSYFSKRILRIYPAFIMAFIFSGIVVPLVYRQAPDIVQWWRVVILQRPPGFQLGSRWIEPNTPLWTISYEFRCYLLVALLSATGWLKHRRSVLRGTLLAFAVFCVFNVPGVYWRIEQFQFHRAIDMIIGAPYPIARFLSTFGFGGCAFLYREELTRIVTGRKIVLAALIAFAALFYRPAAEPAAHIFGGICLYWVTLRANLGPLRRINDRFDISYGTYLYGWPVGIALSFVRLDFLTFLALTIAGSWALGAASWWLIEKPAKRLRRTRLPPASQTA